MKEITQEKVCTLDDEDGRAYFSDILNDTAYFCYNRLGWDEIGVDDGGLDQFHDLGIFYLKNDDEGISLYFDWNLFRVHYETDA